MLFTVDASIFVSAFIPHESRHAKALQFADDVFAGTVKIKQPAIFAIEVPCALVRRSKETNYDLNRSLNVHQLILSSPFISWQIVDVNFSRIAASVGMKYGFRGMDAIYAATAIEFKVPLLTEDSEFKKANLPIPVLGLADL